MRLSGASFVWTVGDFNPRTREGCDRALKATKESKDHFNPRTREGCDHCRHLLGQRVSISIHAPAKGATMCIVDCVKQSKFQSTHPRRVRQGTISRGTARKDFNPRTREGCDLIDSYKYAIELLFQSTHPRRVRQSVFQGPLLNVLISIHAPAKGATKQLADFRQDRRNFNPRTREGCDPWADLTSTSTAYFNPRTREGCDLVGVLYPYHYPDFNPRTREGCDPSLTMVASMIPYFNPRTREGCDWVCHTS